MRSELSAHVVEVYAKNIQLPKEWAYFRQYASDTRGLIENTVESYKQEIGSVYAFRNGAISDSPFPYLNIEDDDVLCSVEAALLYGLRLDQHLICENTILRMFGVFEQFCDQYPLSHFAEAGERFSGFQQRWARLVKIGLNLAVFENEKSSWVKLRNLIAHSAPGSWVFSDGIRSPLEWPYKLVEEAKKSPMLLRISDVEDCEKFFEKVCDVIWDYYST